MWLTWEMWSLSAVILLGAEVWMRNWVFLWPAIAAAVTASAALFGVSESRQVVLFSAIAIGLLAVSRTVLRPALFPKRRRRPREAQPAAGSAVDVLERVGNADSPGAVKAGETVWAAYSTVAVLEPGQRGKVVRVDGPQLVIEPATESAKG